MLFFTALRFGQRFESYSYLNVIPDNQCNASSFLNDFIKNNSQRRPIFHSMTERKVMPGFQNPPESIGRRKPESDVFQGVLKICLSP